MKKKYLDKIKPFFPKALIYRNGELILEPKNNIYFRLDNVNSDLEFDCKMIEHLCRGAHKGLTKYWERFISKALNDYFKQDWKYEDFQKMYTSLGGGCNRKLCIQFIDSDFDFNVLTNKQIGGIRESVGIIFK